MATKTTKKTTSKKANNPELINKTKSLKVASHLLGLTHFIGLPGFIGPLVMMLIIEDQDIKDEAKESLNWAITSLIYLVISGLLVFVLVGIFMLIALIIADVVFRIQAAMAASEGREYRYPMSIRLIK